MKAGLYPVQHIAGRWYELAFDTLHKRHYAYRDTSTQFPHLFDPEPQEEGDTTAFTSTVAIALKEAAAQTENPPSPIEQDPVPMTTTGMVTLAPGRLGIRTGATYASIAHVNPHVCAEPLSDTRGGGGPPGGGGEPPRGGGGPPARGPPAGGPPPAGFNLQAPATAGDTKLVGQAPTTFTG